MKVLIRTIPERLHFAEKIKEEIGCGEIIIDYEHIGRKEGNKLFANLLGNLEEDSIIIEDDQILCDDFLNKCKELINKYPDRIIAFSWLEHYDKNHQFTEERKIREYGKNGFFIDMKFVCLFCVYIPKEIGKQFKKWYYHILETNNSEKTISDNDFKKFLSKGQWYDQILGLFCYYNNLSVYVNAFPSFTGHNIDIKSAMNHNNGRLCKSMNFDYEGRKI